MRMSSMSRQAMSGFVLISLCGMNISCKGKKSDHGAPPNESQTAYSNLYVALSTKAPTNLIADIANNEFAGSQNCNVALTQTIQSNGICLTPKSVTLWATQVALRNNQMQSGSAMQTGGVRLLGSGSGFGKDGYFEGASFNSTTLSALRGSDNLWDTYSKKSTYDLATVGFAWINFVVDFKGSTWEYLVSFVDQPTSNYTWAESCFGKPWAVLAATRAVTLPEMSFKTGDMLICKRSDPTQPCTASGFKWIDSADGSLKDTRPSAPRQVSSAAQLKRACKTPATGNSAPDSTFELPTLRAIISTPVKLYGDLSHGPTSKSNPAQKPARFNEGDWNSRTEKSPFTVYFFEQNGQVTTGDRLDATFNIDFSNFIFVDGVSDLSTVTESDVLKTLTTKQFFAMDKLGLDKMGGVDTGLKSDLTIKLSNTANVDDIYKGPVAGAKAQPVSGN